MPRRLLSVAVVAVACGVTTPSRGEPTVSGDADDAPPADPEPAPNEPPVPARFGGRGQVVVTAASSGAIRWSRYGTDETSTPEPGHFALSLTPGIDVFLFENVSLGIAATVAHRQRDNGANSQSTTLAGGLRGGYNLWLARALSFYPRLTFGFEWLDSSTTMPVPPAGETSYSESSRFGPYIEAFAPLTIHPTSHFFFEMGPSLFHELARARGAAVDGQRTTIGAAVGIGVWWGGRGETQTSNEMPPPKPPRFGARRTIVFSGSTGASASYSSIAGADVDLAEFVVKPGIDVFVVDHFSLGLSASYAYRKLRGAQSRTPTTENDGHSASIAPRIGFDIPIGTWCSLYPQLSGAVGFDRRNSTARKELEASLAVGVFVPLLVHVAAHAFLGFGPSFDNSWTMKRDVSTTSVGVNAVVGGWL